MPISLHIWNNSEARRDKELLEQWAGMVPSGPLQPLQAPHHIPGSALLRHREFPTLATEGRGEVKVGPQATEPLPENGLLTVSSPEATFPLCHLKLIEILEFLSCSSDVI